MRVAITLGLLLTAACASLQTSLTAAERAYDEARYEDADVWLVDLAPREREMTLPILARYHYLRGMTAYQSNRRDEAFHHLSLARAAAGAGGEGLMPVQNRSLETRIAELTPSTGTWRAAPRGANPQPANATPLPPTRRLRDIENERPR